MDEQTIAYYNRTARETARRYEGAQVSAVHELLLRYLGNRKRVLEIGCGSGRDAAFLHSQGYDITAADASPEMLKLAREYHPELSERLIKAAFPLPPSSPLLRRSFDAVVSIAAVMHIPDEELPEWIAQLSAFLAPDGVLMVLSSSGRTGLVHDRDAEGRLLRERPLKELELLLARTGLQPAAATEIADGLGRGIRWHCLVMSKA